MTQNVKPTQSTTFRTELVGAKVTEVQSDLDGFCSSYHCISVRNIILKHTLVFFAPTNRVRRVIAVFPRMVITCIKS